MYGLGGVHIGIVKYQFYDEKGMSMESKDNTKKKSKLNTACMILIILFLFILVLRPGRICGLIYPEILSQYNEILGSSKENFQGQKLGIGHMVAFQFKENKKSLGELYSLSDIKFIPENKTLPGWEGKDKIENWNDKTAVSQTMQRFRIRFTIPVPHDERLAGQTIKGSLHLKLEFPVLIPYPLPKCSTRSEIWDRPMSIHIFSHDELSRLSVLTSQMMKIWLICLALLSIPVLLIVANHLRRQKKAHLPRVE